MDKTCEERIDSKLAREVTALKAANTWEEVLRELQYPDIEPCTWRQDLLRLRRQEDIDYNEAREAWDKLTEMEEEAGEIETYQELAQRALSFEKSYTVYRLQLSWGGPSDEYIIYTDDEDREIAKIEYYFKDWFDGAKREIEGEAFDLVRKWVESEFLSLGE